MHYKKFFSAAALAALLSLSNSAFSDSFPAGPEEAEDTSYYVRLQYNGEFFNIMNGEEVKFRTGSSDNFASLASYKKEDGTVVNTGYKPSYKTSFFAGSAAAGYTMEGVRVELEGLYSQLDTDCTGYKSSASGHPGAPDNAKKFSVDGFKSTESTTAANSPIGTNEGFTTMAAMVNAYYDVDLGNESIPVVPYVGAGVGLARATFAGADHWKLAYQAKAGVSYAVTPEIKVYGGYRYFGLYGNEFKEVTLNITKGSGGDQVADTKKVTLQQEGMFGVHGIEAGVMFNF